MGVLENLISRRSDLANSLAIPDSATCWICLEGKSENHRPLVRSCACRGEAGFGHLDCIIAFITRKEDDNMGLEVFDHDPWIVCMTCHQPYTGQFYHDLASMHWDRYKHLSPKQNADNFYRFRGALDHYCTSLLEQHRLEESLEFAQRLYDLQKGQIIHLGNGKSNFDWIKPWEVADSCNLLGGCFVKLGRLDEAIDVFCEGLNYTTLTPVDEADFAENRATLEAALLNNIAEVHVKRGEGKEAIKLRRKAIAIREEVHGKNSFEWIQGAFGLGCVLVQFQVDEEEGLELIKESKRIATRLLGPLHQHVMKCDYFIETHKSDPLRLYALPGRLAPNMAEVCGLKSRVDLNGKFVEVSSYNPKDGRYKAIYKKGSDEEVIGVKPGNLILKKGVKVVVRGLVSAKGQELNGKKGVLCDFHHDIGRYTVILDEDNKEIAVKPENAIAY